MLRRSTGFTLLETLVSIGMIAMVMAFTGLLFHRSFQVLRLLDEKERTRQAARMGLDRIAGELREAIDIRDASSAVEFEKIDPTATIVEPPKPPEEVPDDYEPPAYGPAQAYPDSARLIVRYETINENLIRTVKKKNGGAAVSQVVVAGVNSFTCEEAEDNVGEIIVTVAVVDNRRIKTVSGKVLCPCIREEFGGS
ncbi:MAG: type II secretion system protein [Candidatus Eremiobacteraeota bacterium]|nr:type II secretion system protein [Candidatus Eremiobacteraeota bacterium]